MQQFEFQTLLTAEATVKVPAEVAAQVERDVPIRVVVLLPDPDEDQQWSSLTAHEFLQGYAESDAVYDDASARRGGQITTNASVNCGRSRSA